jgi:hypothetical protein
MLASVANSSAVALARGSAAAAAAAGVSVSGALSFLPHLVQDMVEPARNFAHVSLKDNDIPLVSGFGPGDTVLVATRAGHLSVYSLPSMRSPQHAGSGGGGGIGAGGGNVSGAGGGGAGVGHGGGACKLESEHPLLDQPSEAIGTRLVEEQQHNQHNNHHNNGQDYGGRTAAGAPGQGIIVHDIGFDAHQSHFASPTNAASQQQQQQQRKR